MSRPPSPISPPPPSMFLSDGGKNNPFDNVSFRGGSDKTSRLGDKQEVFNYTFGSIEDEGGVTRPDPGELQQEVLELAHTNRRLTGENADLTAHLTHAEDTNLSLREQCHHLEHTLSSVQQQLVAARRLEAEMEEVQNQLECEREEKEQLQTRLTSLEKDNLTLTTRLEDLLQQMESDQEDTESQAALQAELVKNHKDEVATLVNELAKWKVEAETYALAAHHLDETAKDLRKLNTALRDEKANLEEQLAHLKEELVSATHSETEISGIDVGEEAEQNNVDTGEVMLSRPHSKGTWGAPSFSTPYCNKSALSSPEDTPLSIHSEIQTMGEYSGSLPFCEKSKNTTSSVVKSEAGVNTVPQPYLSDRSLSSLTSLLNSMLKWWRDWEERGVPLLRGTIEEDTAALHVHFIAHHEELLKLEKELQEIKKQIVIHTPPPSSGRTSVSDGCREGSLSSPRDTQLPSAQHVTPKSKPQKTPGSLVSQLISRFEQSSRSTSPACSELSDRFGFVECNSNLFKMVERSRAGRGSSSSYPDHDCGRSSPSYDGGRSSASSDFGRASPSSPEHTSPTFKTMEDHKIQKKNSSESDSCLGSNLVISEESGDEHYCSSDILSAKDCVGETSPTSQEYIDIVLHNSIEQDTDFTYMDTENTVQETSTTVVCDNIEEDNKEEDLPEDTEEFGGILLECGLETEDLVTKEDNRKEENEDHTGSSAHRDDQEKDNGSTTTVEVDIELETDIYMETSHLMKLMNEVVEQRTIIQQLREQLTLMEDKKESFTAVLTRLYRLTLQVSTDTYKWTEGVRKEWLSVVPRGVEDEGATDPLRTPGQLDDVPLTGTHSREEIESLIRSRCDQDCPPSGSDLPRYVNPENLAAELERELLALKLHVARSHALLHHYQSSSLYGSRSEVSTPPVSGPHHGQGVEAGVECDLCGPTCVPRPCGSAATQTPASPAPVTPECEESAGTSRPWQADEGPSISEDLLHEDDDDDDHLPLTSQHRDLRQWVEVREEEEEEGEEGGGDTMASDHALYAPKPAYDQLDQYRSPKRSGEEKLRRTGLTTISPQAGVSSESDDSDVERSARPIRRTRPPHLHHHHLLLPRRSDPEVTPLSPPPSLVNAEEEEDSPMKDEEDEEEDPLLPSTPESSSSITSAEIFSRLTQGATSGSTDSNGSTSRLLLVISQNTDDTLNASSVPTIPVTPSPLTSPSPPVIPTTPQVEPFASTPTSAITPAAATTTGASTSSVNTTEPIVGRSERSKSCTAVFPSLQDNHLRAAGLSRDDPVPNENLSAQEIESKFTQLSLAFKTDRLTLRQRLDVQQRQRDTAETNFDTEIDQLRSSVLALHADCLDTELIDAVTQVRRHLDILATSSTRLVYASEVWGAVQQEWRVSRALEVLLLHVENVKRMYERDHQELEEMRRVLNEYQIELPVSPGASGALSQSSSDYTAASRRVRALSLAGCTNKSQDNRRISLSSGLTKSQPNSYLTSSRGSRRRASLMPDLKPFQEKFAALAATAAAAAAAATTTAPAAASSSSTNSSTTSTSKDNTEENGQPPTGVYSSITEEGSDSGEEGQDSPSSTTNKNPSINSSIINSLAQLHPDLYAVEPSLQNGDRRLSEESNLSSASQSTAPDAPLPSATPTPIPNPQPQHWLMVALEGVIGWARGGQWPYSPQQTVQGARYAFTSLLLLLAAFFLLLTISSGDSSVLQPYHPGWTTIHHVLHPFVTVRFLGPPPT